MGDDFPKISLILPNSLIKMSQKIRLARLSCAKAKACRVRLDLELCVRHMIATVIRRTHNVRTGSALSLSRFAVTLRSRQTSLPSVVTVR